MNDRPLVIAWGMFYDGTKGLKAEAARHFMVIEEYVFFGSTNIETTLIEWSVIDCSSHENARAQAIVLTEISEAWGCDLTHEPRVRLVSTGGYGVRDWLRTIVKRKGVDAGLVAMYAKTIAEGVPLEN